MDLIANQSHVRELQRPVTIAVVHAAPSGGDPPTQAASAARWLHEAADRGAELVAFPAGYLPFSIDLSPVADAARRRGTTAIAPSVAPQGQLTTIDSRGNTTASHKTPVSIPTPFCRITALMSVTERGANTDVCVMTTSGIAQAAVDSAHNAAVAGGCWVIAAGAITTDGTLTGTAVVVSPTGDLAAGPQPRQGLLTGTISPLRRAVTWSG